MATKEQFELVGDLIGKKHMGRAINDGMRRAVKRGGFTEGDKCLDRLAFGGPAEFYNSPEYKSSKNIGLDYPISKALADWKFKRHKEAVNKAGEREALRETSRDKHLLLLKDKFNHNKKILKNIERYISYIAGESDKCQVRKKELKVGFGAVPTGRYSYSGPYTYEKRYELEFYILIETPGLTSSMNLSESRELFSLMLSQCSRHGYEILFNDEIEAIKRLTASDFNNVKNEGFNPWRIVFGFKTIDELIESFRKWQKK